MAYYPQQPPMNGMPMNGMPMGHGQPVHPQMVQPMIQPQPMMNNQSNTTVVVNSQPQATTSSNREWSTGLCGCLEDCGICLTVMMCPLCYGCHLSAKAGEFCLIPAIIPGWLITLRAFVRGRHKIKGTLCDDCCKVTCCYQLTMCQLARELDNIKNGKTPL